MGRLATSPLPFARSPLPSGGQNQNWPTSGPSGYITLAVCGSPTLQSGVSNQKWPTSGRGGYITPTICRVPNASKRGTKSEVAHKWADWLHHPCRLRGPQRFRAEHKIRRGPQVGRLATSLLPSGGSPMLHSEGQNQNWPTSGPSGYITLAVWGPQSFRAGDKNRSGPQVGRLVTSPPQSPTLQSRG